MKQKSLGLLIMLTVTCLLFSGCPQPKKKIFTVTCDPINPRKCEVKVTIEYFAPTSIDSQVFSTVGVYDLANSWQPDLSVSSSAVVRVAKFSGEVIESEFSTILNPSAANVSQVDSNTTARLYVFEDPGFVKNFVDQALAGDRNYTIAIELSTPIYQSDCGIPTGSYVNHLRYNDPSGVTYLDSFDFNYSVPENFQGGSSCEQATLTIE